MTSSSRHQSCPRMASRSLLSALCSHGSAVHCLMSWLLSYLVIRTKTLAIVMTCKASSSTMVVMS